MCRLFALRAASARPAVRPLWSAPNALGRQSVAHADGWGLAHLEGGRLRVARGVDPAHASADFKARAERLSSALVLAHVRRASVGQNHLHNTHPFSRDGWVFAHNGTVRAFATRRRAFERRIAPSLRAALQGDTDSERCFLLFLTELARARRGSIGERAAQALGRVAAFTRRGDPPGVRPSVANFIATDGDVLLALRFGKMLQLATPGFDAPGPLRSGQSLRELWVSSEPADPALRWRPLAHGQGVAIDGRMVLRRFRVTG